MAFNKKIFWAEDFNKGLAEGGMFTRCFELRQFLDLFEMKGYEIVGLRFDDNNLEVIVKSNESNDE